MLAGLILSETSAGNVHRTRSLLECVNTPDRHGIQPLVSCLLYSAGHRRCLAEGSRCEDKYVSECKPGTCKQVQAESNTANDNHDEHGEEYIRRMLALGADAQAALEKLPSVTRDVSVLDSLLWHLMYTTPREGASVGQEGCHGGKADGGRGSDEFRQQFLTGDFFQLFEFGVWNAMVQVWK